MNWVNCKRLQLLFLYVAPYPTNDDMDFLEANFQSYLKIPQLELFSYEDILFASRVFHFNVSIDVLLYCLTVQKIITRSRSVSIFKR